MTIQIYQSELRRLGLTTRDFNSFPPFKKRLAARDVLARRPAPDSRLLTLCAINSPLVDVTVLAGQ